MTINDAFIIEILIRINVTYEIYLIFQSFYISENSMSAKTTSPNNTLCFFG
jgi:type III secretory pathway component EscV